MPRQARRTAGRADRQAPAAALPKAEIVVEAVAEGHPAFAPDAPVAPILDCQAISAAAISIVEPSVAPRFALKPTTLPVDAVGAPFLAIQAALATTAPAVIGMLALTPAAIRPALAAASFGAGITSTLAVGLGRMSSAVTAAVGIKGKQWNRRRKSGDAGKKDETTHDEAPFCCLDNGWRRANVPGFRARFIRQRPRPAASN